MAARVLVIRPEPGNTETARRLADHGFEAVQLPLTEIAATTCPPLSAPVDVVAVSSPNAIRHATPELLKSFGPAPVYAVGRASADIAVESGLNVAYRGDGDAIDLARHIVSAVEPGTTIAYPCGMVRRPDIEEVLGSNGYDIAVLETYNAKKVSYSTHKLIEVLGGDLIDFVLLHSAETAKALSSLMAAGAIPQITEKTAFYALSDRILDALDLPQKTAGFAAKKPLEEELLRMMAKAANRN